MQCPGLSLVAHFLACCGMPKSSQTKNLPAGYGFVPEKVYLCKIVNSTISFRKIIINKIPPHEI